MNRFHFCEFCEGERFSKTFPTRKGDVGKQIDYRPKKTGKTGSGKPAGA